jgi:(heptosyl)LPS beta-1,4-glucosyltransferase
MRQTISCAIVVFNEERNIREALASVAWMDEIIAVDSYSTDKTVEMCREFTPHVFQRKWNGFGEQKNSAIDRATSDWVFILDADERVSDDLRAEIQRVLETSTPVGPVAYSLPRKNYYYGKWIRWGGVYPDYQLRLFRRGVGRLDDSEPHNRFVFEGLHGDLTHALDHYTERTIEDHFKKFNNFTTLAARERGKTKKRVRWSDLTIRPLFTFWKYYVRRQAFRDGVHGLIISVFASMYTFVKYAKLWDTTRQGTAHPDAK